MIIVLACFVCLLYTETILHLFVITATSRKCTTEICNFLSKKKYESTAYIQFSDIADHYLGLH